MPGQMGNRRVTQRGPRGRGRRRRAQPADPEGRGPRARGRARRGARCLRRRRAATRLGGQGTVELPGRDLLRALPQRARVRGGARRAARRAGAAPPRRARAARSAAAARSRGARRAPAAPAPARSGAALDRRRRRVRPHSARLHGEGQPQGAPAGAARGAQRARASAAASRSSTPRPTTEPSTSTAAEALDSLEGPAPGARAARRRRGRLREVVPQHPARRRCSPARDAGVADVVGARIADRLRGSARRARGVAAEPQHARRSAAGGRLDGRPPGASAAR